MMKSIYLKNGTEFSCNNEGFGVFLLRKDGTWAQQTGTCQTPYFKNKQQFSRYIHKNYYDNDFEKLPRMVSSYGW